MKANNVKAMCKALTDLVNYLNKEVKRTSKCRRCKYRGKSFYSEPCYWHVDCGVEEYDKKASDNAMRLLKRFKLQEALAKPPRQCDIGTPEEQNERFLDSTEYDSYLKDGAIAAFRWGQKVYKAEQ